MNVDPGDGCGKSVSVDFRRTEVEERQKGGKYCLVFFSCPSFHLIAKNTRNHHFNRAGKIIIHPENTAAPIPSAPVFLCPCLSSRLWVCDSAEVNRCGDEEEARGDLFIGWVQGMWMWGRSSMKYGEPARRRRACVCMCGYKGRRAKQRGRRTWVTRKRTTRQI